MIILAIETSCDDSAISLIKANGGFKRPQFEILSHNVSSQTKIHEKWGGVVPTLAKREHGRNLMPLLVKTLKEAGLFAVAKKDLPTFETKKIEKILEREPELLTEFLKTIPRLKKPKIDAIAVTEGPGLEPALWVGINFARALSSVWNKPTIPVNHLEGHLYASIINENVKIKNKKAKTRDTKIQFPAVALIVSGGHTELVLVRDWLKYKLIGSTRDDAVGEAFDKVARILDLPYPGGPQISKLAKAASQTTAPETEIKLPRPMINSGDFDFSFSGLKTAVLYLAQKLKAEGKFNDQTKALIAKDFQQACIDVLIAKTNRAIAKFKPKTVIIGGGVTANQELRNQLEKAVGQHPDINFFVPDQKFTTDNATMIAAAAYLRNLTGTPKKSLANLKAKGQMPLK